MTSSMEAVFLKDYQPSDFLIDETILNFQLAETATTVNARLMMRRNPAGNPAAELVLDGSGLDTRRLLLNGKVLAASEYRITGDKLHILLPVPEKFELESIVSIKPQLNTALEGLYKIGRA